MTGNSFLDRERFRNVSGYWASESENGMVTSAHYKATEAGAAVLKSGGNAIDAAIAVSVALGVAEPNGSGLGGMAMMMVYEADSGKTTMLEGACPAPSLATPELVKVSERKTGYRAVAVPSNPFVLGHAHKNFGSLPLSEILAPAYDLANKGVLITPLQNKIRNEYKNGILKGNASQLILTEDNLAPEPGTTFKTPVLAETIEHIMKNGFESFYSGDIGREIVRDMEENSGFISSVDMDSVPSPLVKTPLSCRFGEWEVKVPPPPCGGIVLIEMLNLFEQMVSDNYNPDDPEAALLLSLIIRKARSDRRKFRLMPLDLSLWDGPDIISMEYAETAAVKLKEFLGAGETSHFNVMDKSGNIVSVTQSIERSFGAKVATPGLGFLYNGFMKGFKIESKKHPHYLKPGAIARSNATPTLVFKDGKPIFSLGSTGSERMVSGIFQVLVRLRYGQSPFEAVKAPRLHCTPESEVFMEIGRFSEASIRLLENKGFKVTPYSSDWSFTSGGLHMLAISESGVITGVADPRRDGSAMGF